MGWPAGRSYRDTHEKRLEPLNYLLEHLALKVDHLTWI